MNEPFNPYQPPTYPEPLSTETRPRGRRVLSIVKILAVLQLTTIVIGLIASVIDVESIMVTGPVLTVLGLICFGAAAWAGVRAGIVLGVSGPAVAVFCFLLIYSQRWSPADAARPIPLIGAAYSAISVPLFILTLIQSGRRQSQTPNPAGPGTHLQNAET